MVMPMAIKPLPLINFGKAKGSLLVQGQCLEGGSHYLYFDPELTHFKDLEQ
jgi:hypothetical protein